MYSVYAFNIYDTHTHTHTVYIYIIPGPSNVPEICVQFHLKLKFRCCQNENALFWMPGQAPLTKRLEIDKNVQNACKNVQNAHKSKRRYKCGGSEGVAHEFAHFRCKRPEI